MALEKLSDESLRRLYENIRCEVAADSHVPQPLMGETAKQRAEQLREEIEQRGLSVAPIDWPV